MHLYTSVRNIWQDESGNWNRVLERTDDANEDPAIIQFFVSDGHIKLYHNFYKTYEVEIIHYDLEAGLRFPDVLFGSKRVVKFETTTLDFKKKHVYKKTFAKDSRAYRNQPDVIVQKAETKIGERKWSFLGNWSSDLAEKCVLVDEKTYYSRGERFARMIQSSFSDQVHCNVLSGTSSFCLMEYVKELVGVTAQRIMFDTDQ